MALEQELATYKARLPELSQQEGKFALVHRDDLIDTFAAYEDALKAGYKRFGLEPFLVKQILTIEPVFYFSRPLEVVQAAK